MATSAQEKDRRKQISAKKKAVADLQEKIDSGNLLPYEEDDLQKQIEQLEEGLAPNLGGRTDAPV